MTAASQPVSGRRRWPRRLAAGAAALVVLLLVAGGGLYAWLRTSLPALDGTLAVPGLQGTVTIVRDGRGIPRIEAETADADAYFALGFVHGQDRLFQMDLARRVGSGRLSELFGERTLAYDRLLRTLGIAQAAQSSWEALDAGTRAAYEAYAAGVNAAMASHEGAWPPEYELLRLGDPEPWTALDSLTVLKSMALLLDGNWREEAWRAELGTRLTGQQIENLWRSDTDVGQAPLPDPPYIPAPKAQALATFPPLPKGGLGSNSWVVDGRHAASGKPLLANDPHLGLGLPGMWYLASLEAPGLRLAGATIPGIPGMILGHNGHVAWGFTTAYFDTQDLFVERIDPDDTGFYETPDGRAPFATRTETIRVRGGDDVTLTVRTTRHGPVVSDAYEPLEKLAGKEYAVALAWAALEPGDSTARAAIRLADARTVADFIAIAADMKSPVQNIVVADTAGSIAYIVPALVPIRRGGDGRVPVPGWTGEHDWTGFIPYDELPRVVDPAEGRLVTANARAVAEGYPHFLSADWPPAYRARRIAALLAEHDGWTVDGFLAMQRDTVSLAAQAILPLLAGLEPETALGREALALLQGWGGDMAADRPQPAIFWAWYAAFARRVTADELGLLGSEADDPPPAFIAAVLDGSLPAWCDDGATEEAESCEGPAALAFDEAAAALASSMGDDPALWTWGAVHQAVHAHPILGRLPVVGRFAALAQPIGGDRFTIDVSTASPGTDGRFDSGFGPGLRAVYDLADLDRSVFVIGIGQSGNLLSPHATDLAGAWVANAAFAISGAGSSYTPLHKLTLNPAE